MNLRPNRGGFLRPFGCGWFIREFLLGHEPEESPKIDPDEGACQEDIFFYYKGALHRAYAEDAVAYENEERIKKGKPIYAEEEYLERVKWYMSKIPSKLHKCRYHSFVTYFGMFKRLEWVEEVKEEASGPQDWDPNFQPRRYYRLTDKGKAATTTEVSDPIMTLYPKYSREMRSAKRYKYRPKAKTKTQPVREKLSLPFPSEAL
jgi:hypothetical protein